MKYKTDKEKSCEVFCQTTCQTSCQVSCEIACETTTQILDEDRLPSLEPEVILLVRIIDQVEEVEEKVDALRCPWCKIKIDATEKRCSDCNGVL